MTTVVLTISRVKSPSDTDALARALEGLATLARAMGCDAGVITGQPRIAALAEGE